MGAAVRVLLVTLGLAAAVLLLAVLRRPLKALLRLLCRSGVGLGVRAALRALGAPLGLALGVNLWNALVLGLLGVPGLGLLLMLNWVTGL